MKLEKRIQIYNYYFGEDNRSYDFLSLVPYRRFKNDEKDFIIKNESKVFKLTLEVEEPILDEKERKYLSGVIRPFRDRIKFIKKLNEHYIDDEYILIKTDSNSTPLPYFKKDTMYKSMELNKEYTLEELGL